MSYIIKIIHQNSRRIYLVQRKNVTSVWQYLQPRNHKSFNAGKVKGLPQQAEVAQAVPGSLRPQIFLTFGTTRVVSRQPYAPAVFTPEEVPGTHF
jgi:hypothetical protein